MKENWFAITIFSVIFGILGYLLGCCSVCCNTSNCCAPQACCSQQACCAPGGGAACCAGGEKVFIHEHGGHDHVHAIIHELEMEDFTGDTTIVVDGATIHMTKSEDGNVEVKVEMEEGGEWHGDGGNVRVEKRVMKATTDGDDEEHTIEIEIVDDEEE